MRYRRWIESSLAEFSARTGVTVAVENMFPVKLPGERGLTFHAGQDLDDGKENQIDYQWQPAAITISEQTEDERTHRPKSERERDGESNIFVCLVKVCGNRRQRHDDEEEIERIQRPTEKTRKQRRSVTLRTVVRMFH